MFDSKDREARQNINELATQLAELRVEVKILYEAHNNDPSVKKAVDEYAIRKFHNDRLRPKPMLEIHSLDVD